jgi:hypothetical protein
VAGAVDDVPAAGAERRAPGVPTGPGPGERAVRRRAPIRDPDGSLLNLPQRKDGTAGCALGSRRAEHAVGAHPLDIVLSVG